MSLLEDCLPAELRAASPIITRMAAGLSGAGVYRVDAGDRAFVLKVSRPDEPEGDWRRKVQIQRLAADAGVTPRVVHTDEERRAVLADLVVDRSFMMLVHDPHTRADTIAALGHTLRRVHDLPPPPGAEPRDMRQLIGGMWKAVSAAMPVPAFADDAIARVLGEEPPPAERAPVLSHNDVNPTNLVHDGLRVLLLDWDTARPNDPYFDLAAASLFLRFDEPTALHLLSAYDGAPVTALPARFRYGRRLAAGTCGAIFLYLARQSGHAGENATTEETAPSQIEVYQRRRAGTIDIAKADGQWAMGLALLKESLAL